MFEKGCGCSHVQWPFPFGCNGNTKNVEIAAKLSRAMIHVLIDVPPSVLRTGEPLVPVFRSTELKPKWECERFNQLSMRRARHVEGQESSGDSEDDEEESSEEESVA